MSLLQNITTTIYLQLQTLQPDYPGLVVVNGLPAEKPEGMVVALEHDKSKVDEQYEIAGYRRRPRVFFADVYTTSSEERNNICEMIKDLFENRNTPVVDAVHHDTGIVMMGEGVRIEVDQTQAFKARAKIYVSTLIS